MDGLRVRGWIYSFIRFVCWFTYINISNMIANRHQSHDCAPQYTHIVKHEQTALTAIISSGAVGDISAISHSFIMALASTVSVGGGFMVGMVWYCMVWSMVWMSAVYHTLALL